MAKEKGVVPYRNPYKCRATGCERMDDLRMGRCVEEGQTVLGLMCPEHLNNGEVKQL